LRFTNSVAPKIFTEWLRPHSGLAQFLGSNDRGNDWNLLFHYVLANQLDKIKHARVVEACAEENEANAVSVEHGLCFRKRGDDLEIMTRKDSPGSIDRVRGNGREDSDSGDGVGHNAHGSQLADHSKAGVTGKAPRKPTVEKRSA
jgi:hypothetical protein